MWLALSVNILSHVSRIQEPFFLLGIPLYQVPVTTRYNPKQHSHPLSHPHSPESPKATIYLPY